MRAADARLRNFPPKRFHPTIPRSHTAGCSARCPMGTLLERLGFSPIGAGRIGTVRVGRGLWAIDRLLLP